MTSYRWLGLIALLVIPGFAAAEDWPQWLGTKRDGVWREDGIVDKFPEGGPTVRWRVPIGAGYAGPAIANGKVFVCDRVALDDSYLKEFKNGPSKERVFCLNESDGKVVWKHEYETNYQVAYPLGPRTTPLIRDGKVYTLGTMGHLFCLDEKTGKPLWSKSFAKDLKAKIPQWGFAANPLLDGNRLICLVGGEDSVAVAFNKDSGEVLWRSLTAAEPGYCPPIIVETGGKAGRQLIIWHPEAVNGLDPESGKLLWTQPFKSKAGLTAPTPIFSNGRLFVTAFYNGPLMLKLDPDKPEASVLWRGKGRGETPDKTDGLHAIMPTPVFAGDYMYGICSYGELRCLKANTGERVWESLAATGGQRTRWGNAFLTPHKDRFFLFNEHGDLIIAKLTPEKYEEISRAHLLEPTNRLANRMVVWSHPAYANRCVFVRNDREIVCVSLAAKEK
jgi:outer membrane protein assembly factor BamB